MALHAALNDRRFSPVRAEELRDIQIEISVLTPWYPVENVDDIVPGRDGLILVKNGQQGVLLPQVAIENHLNREQFLEALCRKSGLPPGSWKNDTKLYAFQAEVFSETDFKSSIAK
jgi:AmmeMemoRadiSam system protein A